MPTSPRLRRRTSKPLPIGWCGGATGPTRMRRTSRTTRCCSTSCCGGRRRNGPATAFWCRTRRSCMAFSASWRRGERAAELLPAADCLSCLLELRADELTGRGAVLHRVHADGDRIAELECVRAPAVSRQRVRTAAFDAPLGLLALVVDDHLNP